MIALAMTAIAFAVILPIAATPEVALAIALFAIGIDNPLTHDAIIGRSVEFISDVGSRLLPCWSSSPL